MFLSGTLSGMTQKPHEQCARCEWYTNDNEPKFSSCEVCLLRLCRKCVAKGCCGHAPAKTLKCTNRIDFPTKAEFVSAAALLEYSEDWGEEDPGVSLRTTNKKEADAELQPQ